MFCVLVINTAYIRCSSSACWCLTDLISPVPREDSAVRKLVGIFTIIDAHNHIYTVHIGAQFQWQWFIKVGLSFHHIQWGNIARNLNFYESFWQLQGNAAFQETRDLRYTVLSKFWHPSILPFITFSPLSPYSTLPRTYRNVTASRLSQVSGLRSGVLS